MDAGRSMIAVAALAALVGTMTAAAQQAPAAPPAGPGPTQAATAAPPLIREGATEKITPHVYVIPDNGVPMVPNVGIVVG